jgi:hypothetical protein
MNFTRKRRNFQGTIGADVSIIDGASSVQRQEILTDID